MKVCRIALAFWFFAILPFGQAFAQGRQEEKSQWAPTANFLVGKFNTDETAPVFEAVFGLEPDLRGRSWDIGAARGRPGHSYIRIVYTEVRMDDGSRAFDSFENNVLRDVKLKGIKFERMWRLGPSRWPVAPMLSLHGGIGKVSGLVHVTAEDRFCSPFAPRSQCFFEEDFPAKRIFGEVDWIPIGGAAIGATADILDYATIAFSVYGVESPGIYKGSIQFTYWPWRSK